ncbi:hypothetical protein F511_29679 [Dorcoceras hygrometricum]|uniref:Uncharacterized protein n=1 Tax=Dorcoceras hygrometricum TaxID=472368 RepID=A0A2Z7AWF6_9LAMI|nr:hypothetical protein F511_29679 [Dorcoceras hygrometricum]
MSSYTASPVRSVLNAVDSSPESPEVKGPWLPDQAKLGSKNAPWYEEKSSNLRSSDISFIKEKGGCSTISKFIAALCQNIKISPSQLAPNSYSFLLAFGVLLRYHNLPLVPYVLMQLVQVKRLGPGKFYLSHKGDHAFMKGYPSSHKGWMSRIFFVKRVGKKRDPWKCEMHCRDNMYTLTPRTPDRSPNMASFLDAMREERMGKASMLRLLEEEAAAASSGAAAPSKKAPKKRRTYTQPEKEARCDKKKKKEASTSRSRHERITEEGRAPTPSKHTTKDRPKSPPVIAIAEVSSPKKKGLGRVPPLDYTEDSLVASPSGVVATRYICNIATNRDIDLLRRADDSEAVSHFAAQITLRATRSGGQCGSGLKFSSGIATRGVASVEHLRAGRAYVCVESYAKWWPVPNWT